MAAANFVFERPRAEEDPTQDNWLDNLGSRVFRNEPEEPDEDETAAPTLDPPAAQSRMRGVSWADAQAAPGRPTEGTEKMEDDENGCHCCGVSVAVHGSVMDSILYRLGYTEGKTGLYYRKKDNHLSRAVAHVRNVWVFVGFFIFSLLMFLPLWNANRLLLDPAFSYFAGKTTPRALLSVCLSLPIFYVCTVSLVFKRGALQNINEQTILTIMAVFLGILGFCMMTISMPMFYYSTNTYKEITYSCASGYATRELYLTSQALQVLRNQTSCASRLSVRECTGFQPTIYTDVLQNMEATYRCSGYCFDPTSLEKAAAAETASRRASLLQTSSGPSLLQLGSSTTRGKAAHRAARAAAQLKFVGGAQRHLGVSDPLRPAPLSVGVSQEEMERARQQRGGIMEEFSRLQHETAPRPITLRQKQLELQRDYEVPSPSNVAAFAAKTAGSAPGPATISPEMDYSFVAEPPAYAPTLFSPANWQASCDGVAANFMRHSLGDMAVQTFAFGFAMIAASIAVGFLTFIGASIASSKQTN
eukprot:TRINITY_DN55112_c0_g1_i1.p1 TRINITY_DN55112_c0_g1~~TRINITY_DN55112_c0_g1_i1.p1  ORF type:complete len:576 (-),score=117.51 TRINITY_DN55112_c0_g1_i1:67-1659(-)